MPGAAPTIFISAGELSGDGHAAHLAEALQQLRAERGLPPAVLEGNGSARMAAVGVEILCDITHMGAIGTLQILTKVPRFAGLLRRTLRHILRTRPQLVLLVDSPEFHLKYLATQLRRRGYKGKLVYFVPPIRWQSLYDPAELVRSLDNPRFLQLRELCDLSLLIYPVSLKTYEQLDIPHVFIGHPACGLVHPQLSDAEWEQILGTGRRKRIVIGTLTGSRAAEVRCIAPQMFGALRIIGEALREEGIELVPVTAVAHPDLRSAVVAAARRAELSGLVLLDRDSAYDMLCRSDLVLVKSGTGLHECVVANVPAVLCYRVARHIAWVARHIQHFAFPFIGLPNLLAGKEVVPELLQEQCNPLRIAAVAGELLFDKQRRAAMRGEYAQLRGQLCPDLGDGLTPLQRGAAELQRLLRS